MMTSRAWLAVVLFLLVVVGKLLALETANADATVKRFDIPAAAASESLKRFSEQAGVEVAFGTATTDQITTNAVRGEYLPREALTLLLAGTDLVAIEKTGAFVVVRSSNAPKDAAPSPTRRTVEKDEEVIVLSPFIVSGDRDNGYVAQETLAGTRMRTSLRDVGAPITVVTKELMDDLAATALQDALIFTPSVDTYVAGAGAGQTGESYRYDSGRPFSVRGFVQGNLASSDFFTISAPPDTYNVERITLSRGPNSILFGVGGPGGAAITSTKRALYGKSIRTFQTMFDNFGSKRGSFDYNQVLKESVLAVRVNGLLEEKHTFRLNEGRINQRYTLGISARPFRRTTITANYESYRYGSNYVPLQWVFDGGVMRWQKLGSPNVTSPVTAVLSPAGKLAIDPNNALIQTTAQQLIYVNGLPLSSPVVNYRYELTPNLDNFSGLTGVRAQVYRPEAMYGTPRGFNPAFGTFDDPAYWANGKWLQGFIEQQLWSDAYLEIAGNLSRENSSAVPASSATVNIDTSQFLPNGSPNPGFGQYYLNTGSTGPVLVYGGNDTAQGRATFVQELDLTRYSSWLGKHNFAMLGQLTSRERFTDNKYITNLASANRAGFGAPAAATNIIGFRQYLSGGALPMSFGPREAMKQIDAINRQAAALGATSAEAVPIHAALRNTGTQPPQRYLEKSTVFSLALQSHLLKGRLVTTFGFRRDAIDTYLNSLAPLDADGFYVDAKQQPLPADPTFRDAGHTRTAGAVLRVTNWLDLSVNRSNNFSPSSRSNTNFDGKPLGSATGVTTDYGVRLFFLDQKLIIGLNRFESNGKNIALGGVNPIAAGTNNIITRLRNNYKANNDAYFIDMPSFIATEAASTALLWSTQSSVAKGYEATITFNPNRNWRIMVSGSSNENVNGERGADVTRFLYTNPTKFTGVATWETFVAELSKVASGQPSAVFPSLNPSVAADRNRATTDAAFLRTQLNNIGVTYGNIVSGPVGVVSSVNGKYAANGVMTYTLPREGWLKGWSTGGNFRYRSAPTIGYHSLLSTAGVPNGMNDVTRPIQGSAYWEFGVMLAYERKLGRHSRCKIQLNIDNPLNDQKPRLVSVGTDTDAIYGTPYAIVPLRWEMRTPRTTRLTTTIWF